MRYSGLHAALTLGLALIFLLPSCNTGPESASSPTRDTQRVLLAYEPDSTPTQEETDDRNASPVLREPRRPESGVIAPQRLPLYLERFPTLVVRPNPMVDYKMLEVRPNPNIDYSILEIDELGVLRRHPRPPEAIRKPGVVIRLPQQEAEKPEAGKPGDEEQKPEEEAPESEEDAARP